MLALIGNINLLELGVVLVVALMIFGRNLPEVAMRGAAHLMRLRKTVAKMWREAGLEDELRRVRRDIEREARELKKIEPYDFGTQGEDDPAGPKPNQRWTDYQTDAQGSANPQAATIFRRGSPSSGSARG